MKVFLESLSYERGDDNAISNDVKVDFEYNICTEHQIRITMNALVGITPQIDTARFKLHTEFLCELGIVLSTIEEDKLIEMCIEEIVSQIFAELIIDIDCMTRR